MNVSPREWTTAPVRVGEVAPLKPEFLRLNQVEAVFGLKKFITYQLLREQKLRSVLLRQSGAKNGVRLIEVASVREFLAQHLRTGL